MSSKISRSLIINTIWSFVGRFGYLTIALTSNIILARMLDPKEFGQLAIVMFFIILGTVLVESGLSGALIRRNEVSDLEYSTVFTFNVLMACLIILTLIFSSKHISIFYDDPKIENLLIVSSLSILFTSLRIIQNTKLIRSLEFKKKAFYEFLSIFLGSLCAIFLAMAGYGVWSLVASQIFTSAILTILLWFFVERVKFLGFNFYTFKSLYRFGVNTTLASVLNTFFDNVYQLILAKYFNMSNSGYFYQAKKLQDVPAGIIESTLSSVFYSTLSKIKDDSLLFNKMYYKTVRIGNLIIGIIFVLIFFYADNIIEIIYGDKWLGAVFYLKMLILASFFYLQEIFNRNIFKIFDKTEKILHLELFKKFIQSITILYGIYVFDIKILIYGFIVTSFISFNINYYFARKVQKDFSFKEFFNIYKVIFVSLVSIVLFNYLSRELFYLIDWFLLPFILLFYFSLLYLVKAFSFKDDFLSLINIFRGK